MNAIIQRVVELFPDPDNEAAPGEKPESGPDSEPSLTAQSGSVPGAGGDQSALPTNDPAADPFTDDGENDAADAVQEFLTWISHYVQTQMISFAGSLSSLLSYGVLILIFVFFLLLGNTEAKLVPSKTGEQRFGILAEIEQQIRKYLLMKTVISLVTGFVFGFVLWIFGVPLAVVFGFMAFLLNFIPNIGPLISTILPVPFLVLNSGISPTSAIICFVLIGAIQFVSGNVIETRIMGKSFDVSPIALLLALMFFGLVWGIVGMFLATPIASIIKIVLQQRESTRPLANLMAGRLEVFDSAQS
jgi:AI-2 transport protein TqsA